MQGGPGNDTATSLSRFGDFRDRLPRVPERKPSESGEFASASRTSNFVTRCRVSCSTANFVKTLKIHAVRLDH